jgi:hypothetical protein
MNCPWNRPKLWEIKPVSSSLTVDCLPVPALPLDCRLLAPSRKCVGRALSAIATATIKSISEPHQPQNWSSITSRKATATLLAMLGHPAPHTRRYGEYRRHNKQPGSQASGRLLN